MSFQVTILAAGTRGDVQPYVALALGLHDQGGCVIAGLPLAGDARAPLDVAELGRAIRAEDGVRTAVRRVAHAPAFALH